MIPVSRLLGEHVDGNAVQAGIEAGTEADSATSPAQGPDATTDGAAEPTATGTIAAASRQQPFVVWYVTARCPLACRHCADRPEADGDAESGELSTDEGRRLLSDLADLGVSAVRFAGGDPLCRDDLVDLVAHASDVGLRPVLSTNGTRLTDERALELATAGLAAVDVSVAGLSDLNDDYRGVDGAFVATLEGLQASLRAGLATGLEYTVTGATAVDLPSVIDTFRAGGVDRLRIAHGPTNWNADDGDARGLTAAERRAVVRTVCDRTVVAHHGGDPIETVLLGNHADAGFLVEFAHERFGEAAARRVYDRLEALGGAPAGERAAAVDPHGHVRPGPGWRTYSLGNVRDRPFADIWTADANPLLAALRAPENRLTDRCRDCRYRSVCGGASRHRALADGAGVFAPDPQCYLRPWERRGASPGANAD